ncbi:unnamed protein product [Phytomonas sp. EM1]|nr:unnamed protein product [Phytomonas sp. EM1]|eukprot:CCW64099.1 unnamed protein product [Phytomonas sp. isolate EM1]
MLLKEVQTKRIGRAFEILCSKMMDPLSTVFSRLSLDSHLKCYDAYLYLLKCALRVFGCGVFEPRFYTYLLETTWGLCGGLNSVEDADARSRRLRLLEYAMKILEKMVVFFPTKLNSLPFAFFVPPMSTVPHASHSLFELVVVIIETRSSAPPSAHHDLGEEGEVVSEKLACRAARLLTMFLAAEDGDEFVSGCVKSLCESPLLPRLLRSLIVGFLADDTSAEALREWDVAAERVAGEMDVDMDDEASLTGCSEQLFLALTGSTNGGPASLRAAWLLVNRLLEGGEGDVTAALHAIGIGYYTMAASATTGDHRDYLDFLHGRLLPMMQAASFGGSAPTTSLFILRRVVWLVGMWCESVPHPPHRRQVHAALETVLRAYQGSPVMVLTALRAVENFVSDSNFSVEELTETSLETIFGSLQSLLPRLRSPDSVKAVAGLAHVLIEKGALRAHGDFVLDIFLPAVVQLLSACEAAPSKAGDGLPAGGEGGSLDDGEEGGGGCRDMITLGALLECLQSSIKVCATEEAVWRPFSPVVVACSAPGRVATPWVEDGAWALLLEMGRGVGKAGGPATLQPLLAEALRWSLHHTQREFSALPLVLRCVYTLLLGWGGSAEDFFAGEATPLQWLTTMWCTPIPELRSAYFCALTAIVRRGGDSLRRGVLLQALALMAASEDIQAEEAGVLAACLVYVCLPVQDPGRAALSPGEPRSVVSDIAEAVNNQPQLLEKLVLLLDVSPNRLCSHCITFLLRQCLEMLPQMSPEDRNMVNLALESSQVTMDGSLVAFANQAEDNSAEYDRPSLELLLELLGDEAVDPSSPHLLRLSTFFADLLA